MVHLFYLLIGLLLLVIGSKGTVHNASVLSKKLNIPSLVIGIIFVGIGTSLPELFVTLFSGLDKASDLGLGNIIGSNITNVGLIFGVAILLNSVYIGTVKTQKNAFIYFFLVLFFSLLLFMREFSFLSGLLLLLLGFLLIAWEIIEGRKGSFEEDKKEMRNLSSTNSSFLFISLYFFLSLMSLILGSKLVVDSGVEIASLFGVSSFIIGATIIAMGTSLPELSITITGSLAGEKKIVMGNILGSNIYNILLCGGLLGVFNVQSLIDLRSLFFFIFVSLFFCFLIFLHKGKIIPRFFGFLLLAFYFFYLIQYFFFNK